MEIEKIPLRCGLCHARYPDGRPQQVGEAWTDGSGHWIAHEVYRNGTGARLGPANYFQTDPWPPDPSGPTPLFVMEALRRPFNPLLVEYVYECRDKHAVGASDAAVLIGWLDLARDHGKRKIYLPAMSMVPV